jgi:hypothetical protein
MDGVAVRLKLPEKQPAATKLQKAVDGPEASTYMAASAADAASTGSAFVSRLFLVGTTDARNQRTGEWMRVGSLTLLVYMKGHVGGGPVTDSLWVSADRLNLCRSLM